MTGPRRSRREALNLATRIAAAAPLALADGAVAQGGAGQGWREIGEALARTGAARISSGVHRLDGPVRLPPSVVLSGEGDAVLSGQLPGALLTVPGNREGVQTSRAGRITGLRLHCDASGGRRGTALLVENNAALTLRDVGAQGAAIGFHFDRAQFLELDGLRAVGNDIGVYCRPTRVEGGANSLTFVHPVIASNTVGMLIDNSGNVYPQGDLVLVNPQFLSNAVCALAVIGSNSRMRTQVQIYGFAPEENGVAKAAAPADHVHQGTRVARASIHGRFARISIIGGTIGEYGSTDPCIVLEGSTLSLHDVDGYGGPTGTVVRADQDSAVVISGSYGLIGACHGVVAFHGHLDRGATRGVLAGPLRREPEARIGRVPPRNASGAPGEAIRGAVLKTADPASGACIIAFAARPGDSERNVFRLPFLPAGAQERVMLRLDVETDRDTRVALCVYPNEGTVHVELRAHAPTLLCFWANDVRNAAGLFTIYPRDGDAPVMTVRAVRVLAGRLDDPQLLADGDALCSG